MRLVILEGWLSREGLEAECEVYVMGVEGKNSAAWEQKVREVSARLEEDLRRAVTYINDEVVPEVRRGGMEALRVAAAELHKVAQKMDDHARGSSAGGGTVPPPVAGRSGESKE